MKNAILISGAIAAVLGLQIVSYRFGVNDGQHREKYGETLMDMAMKIAECHAFTIKVADAMKTP